MDKKKRLAYLKEIDAHVGFHTGNGIAPQILDLKKVSDNMFVTNCNIRKVRNKDEQETYLRVNPNKNNNGFILTEYSAFKKVMNDVFEELDITDFTLDDGTGTDRTILSGIHAYYEPEELVGKTLIAITNLPPRKMMGIESCGMLLSAVNNLKDSEDEELHLLMVDNHIPAGAKLY